MSRLNHLTERWGYLEERADHALALYEEGYRAEGVKWFRRIWREFRATFFERKQRNCIPSSYMETMAMVLNHLYMELDPKQPGQEQELWDLCWDVCYMMYPDEIWIEDYACCIGRMMHEKGWYSECDEWFQRYYMMEPDHPSYAANWALCLVKRGEMQRAQTLLDTALQENSECDGTSLEYYLIAKQLYRAMGKQEQEKLCAERICGLDEYLLEDEPNFLEEDLSKIF